MCLVITMDQYEEQESPLPNWKRHMTGKKRRNLVETQGNETFKTEHISKMIKNKFTYTWICILKKQQLQSNSRTLLPTKLYRDGTKCQWITSNKQFLWKEMVSLVVQTTEASCCVPTDKP